MGSDPPIFGKFATVVSTGITNITVSSVTTNLAPVTFMNNRHERRARASQRRRCKR